MKRLAFVTLVAIGLAVRAEAGPITYSATSGALSAEVAFNTAGSNLIVTLTNTALVGAVVPVDILTAVFFDMTGFDGGLTPVSALLAPGSSILLDDPTSNVGGEWAYAGNIAGKTPGGQNYGISSSGLDIFGSANFNGSNLDGPDAVNGMSYGLVPESGLASNANPKISRTPLISNSVIFTLSGLPTNFILSRATIGNVYFQYGTSLSEPHISVPEPATILLMVPGALAVLAGSVRSRRKRQALPTSN
jgi:hypothetical protein